MKTRRLLLAFFALAPAALFATELPAADSAAAKPKAGATKPYPLATCIVTDSELGSMGDETRLVHEGQEVKFCCAPCERRFLRNPARFLKKLEPSAAPTATQGPAPADIAPADS